MTVPENERVPIICQLVTGMKVQGAITRCELMDYTTRIVSEDDTQFMCTRDYRPDRVNLTVEKGIVTRATIG